MLNDCSSTRRNANAVSESYTHLGSNGTSWIVHCCIGSSYKVWKERGRELNIPLHAWDAAQMMREYVVVVGCERKLSAEARNNFDGTNSLARMTQRLKRPLSGSRTFGLGGDS